MVHTSLLIFIVCCVIIFLVCCWKCWKCRSPNSRDFSQNHLLEEGRSNGTFVNAELDLRGMIASDALWEAKRFLHENEGSKVKIITGRGHHSDGGKTLLKPAIQKLLKEEGLFHRERDNGGSLLIDIY